MVDSAEKSHRLFENAWRPSEFMQARSLLGRIFETADSAGIQLFIDSGTLLGHVRMGTILPWDDDIDLAMIGGPEVRELAALLRARGLQVVDGDVHPSFRKYLKVCDPSYAPVTWNKLTYSWPFIDVFPLTANAGRWVHPWDEFSFSNDMVLPLQPMSFLGLKCWNYAQPLSILDTYYGNWRVMEVSTWWDHRHEQKPAEVVRRPIQTGVTGMKVDGIPDAVRAAVERGDDPYWLGYYPGGTAFPEPDSEGDAEAQRNGDF